MAVRRAASPSRSPSAGDRRKRSRSAAVARRRRETRRSSSEESQRELRRVAAAKARDASPTPAAGAAASPRRARRSLSLGRRDEGQRDDNKSRSSGRGRKDERHEEHTAPHRRESSEKDLEQVQCKQCGSYCRGQAGLKMHQAYSKKRLAYGYWNKGIKPWDKCLTMANKIWQVRERKDKQSRGPQAPQRDDRPTGNQNDRARQHDDESRQPREREKRKVSVPREGGRASPSREDRRGRERSRRGRSERRRSRAAERSAETVTLTEAKKTDKEPESSRRQPPRRREKPESGQDDVKHVKTSKSAEGAKKKVAEKTKPASATKTKVVPVDESEDEEEEESSSSSYSYYTTEASPQLSGPAAPKAKPGLQPTSKAKATSPVSAQVALKAAKAKPKAAPAAASSSSAGPRGPGEDVSLVNSVLTSQAEMMRWWLMQQHLQAGQE